MTVFEFTYELITVAASNPHFIFLFCNLIILILILVSLEPTLNSDHNHTTAAIPLPPPPTLATNENKSIETTTKTALPVEEATTNVLIDVDHVSYDCKVKEHEELQDDELRRRVEEFIDKINRGWKAEKLSLNCNQLTSLTH